jgi:hypothetical protein
VKQLGKGDGEKMDSFSATFESNVSRLQAQLSDVLSVRDVRVLEGPDRVVSFSGHLLRDAESAYAALRQRFERLGYTPLLQRQGDSEVVIAQQGVIAPRTVQPWINIALFLATLLSTLLTGAFTEVGQMVTTPQMGSESAARAVVEVMLRQPALLLAGLPFSLTGARDGALHRGAAV